MANEIKFTQGSRNEAILHEIINKLNGEQVGELQPPRSRVEILLQEILEKIGSGEVDPEEIERIVREWLDEHPEATTTVEDGSITKAKLDSNLQGTVDDVVDLKSQISGITTATTADEGKALKAKTVSDGKVIEWEFGEAGGGLTATQANLLLTILGEGVYGSDQEANIELLRKALMDIAPVSISAVLESTPLVGLYYSDLMFTVTATFDDESTMVVDGYRIVTPGAVVSGSNTVTVSYRGVTTNVTFTASDVSTHSVTYNLTDVTSSNRDYLVIDGERYATEISLEDDDHYISSYSVTMGGVDVTSTVWFNGNIVIGEVTGDVVITVVAAEYTYLPELIQRRSYTNEGDSTTRLYSDEYQNFTKYIYYKHVGRVTEYPAKYDCLLYWTVTNNGEANIPLDVLGFGMVSGDQSQYITNNAIAYWQQIDNTSHSLEPGASLSGTYTLKAGWQLILTTTVDTQPYISTQIRGGFVPETFDDYSLLYTITNVSADFPEAGSYNAKKIYSDNGTTEIDSFNGFWRRIATGVGPVDYDVIFRCKYDPEISISSGRMDATCVGYVSSLSDTAANYGAIAKPVGQQNGCNVWRHGSMKAESSNMYFVSDRISSSDSVTLEIYAKEAET